MQTADGNRDPAGGIFGNAVLAVQPKAYGLADSFTPPSWKNLNAKDLDLGSGSPVIFPFKNRTLLATSSKEGVIYVLDAKNLGGGIAGDHAKALYTSPRLGNDEEKYYGHGVWGSFSTYEDAQGTRWLYVPMWGPPGSARSVSQILWSGAAWQRHGADGDGKRRRRDAGAAMDVARPGSAGQCRGGQWRGLCGADR